MSGASRDMDNTAEQNKFGPDYFGYCTREVAHLLSQSEDFVTYASQTSGLAESTCGSIRETNVTKPNCANQEGSASVAGSLFCDALKPGVSEFRKERLNGFLRQSVILLMREVDEIVDPVIAIHRIHRYITKTSSSPGADCEGDGKRPPKKLKLSSSSSSLRSESPISCSNNVEVSGTENMDLARPGKAIPVGVVMTETSRWSSESGKLKSLCDESEVKSKGEEHLAIKNQKRQSNCEMKSKGATEFVAAMDHQRKSVQKLKSGEWKESLAIKDQNTETVLASHTGRKKEEEEVNDELQLLLQTDSTKVEETMKKISAELLESLERRKQKLEELLDTIMSECRLMTLAEKRHLQKLIQKLPPQNLNRVVDIIERSKASAKQSSDEIFVDLEKMDNTTLWRLYYYVEALENARKLSVAS